MNTSPISAPELLDGTQAMIAHREWRNRPADQRFQSLTDLRAAVARRHQLSTEVSIPTRNIKVEANAGNGLTIAGAEARMTHWSFGQMAGLGKAPAGFLRELPAPLVADILNDRLQRSDRKSLEVFVGAHEHGDAYIRALTSEKYSRIPDFELVDQAIAATEGTSFRPPLGYAGGVWGAPMIPSGLYASDRDVFVMLVDEEHTIETRGEVLKRGFIVSNSEVGAGTYYLLAFLYRAVCGNNIIHGGELLREVRIIHKGNAAQRARDIAGPVLRHYIQEDTSKEIAMVQAAMATNVGANDGEVVTWMQAKGFTKAHAVKAVEAAVREEGGAGTLWQAVQGLTALARTIQHADARVDAERAAGALLKQVA